MKTNFNSLQCATHCGKISFSARLTGALTFLVLLFCLSANAQIAPASNISGPLKAYVNDTNVVVTSEIATELDPVVSYTIVNNTTGAYIVSQGAFNYGNTTGTGTQNVVINAGTLPGSFTVKLNVTTPAGNCESSKSVTVLQAPGN